MAVVFLRSSEYIKKEINIMPETTLFENKFVILFMLLIATVVIIWRIQVVLMVIDYFRNRKKRKAPPIEQKKRIEELKLKTGEMEEEDILEKAARIKPATFKAIRTEKETNRLIVYFKNEGGPLTNLRNYPLGAFTVQAELLNNKTGRLIFTPDTPGRFGDFTFIVYWQDEKGNNHERTLRYLSSQNLMTEFAH